MEGSPPARLAAAVGSRRWVVTLSALTAVTALSIDLSLPAQPTLARVFGASSSQAQLTLSLFLAAFAAGQLVVGFLSDALGRRRVQVAGLALYALAGFLCSLATTLPALLALRMLQGLGAAAGPVVARAMVRDTQPAAGAARILSSMVAVLAIAPMVAPLLGGALLAWLGWRSIFLALGLAGALFTALAALTLGETLPPGRRAHLTPAALAAGFAEFFRTPGTRLPTLLLCASFAGQFAYIAGSPFVFIEGYGLAPQRFALVFGGTALALMISSATGGRLLRAGWTPHRLIGGGAALVCAGGLLAAAGVRAPALGFLGLWAPMLVYFLGLGLLGPSATALAMHPVPRIAGTASATIGFLQMGAGAFSGWATTRAGGSDPHAMALVIAALGAFVAAVAAAVVASAPRDERAAPA